MTTPEIKNRGSRTSPHEERNQEAGMLEVPWLAVELRESFAMTLSTHMRQVIHDRYEVYDKLTPEVGEGIRHLVCCVCVRFPPRNFSDSLITSFAWHVSTKLQLTCCLHSQTRIFSSPPIPGFVKTSHAKPYVLVFPPVRRL